MISSAAQSRIGLRRKTNQDRLFVEKEHHLYVLADGMGAQLAGEKAAEMCTTLVADFVRFVETAREVSWPFGYDLEALFEQNVLRTALLLADSKVSQAAQATERYTGMASTVVVLWVRDNKAYYTHLGDSRAYILRAGELRLLTEDHSLVQEQLKRGLITREEASRHTLRHVVTCAVGCRNGIEPLVVELELEAGDKFLLCSDGLTDLVDDQDLESIMGSTSGLDQVLESVLDAAESAGGNDNVSAILVSCSS